MSANNKISIQIRIAIFAECLDGEPLPHIECKRSLIVLSMNCKTTRKLNITPIFRHNQCTYGKMPFCVKRIKFSSEKNLIRKFAVAAVYSISYWEKMPIYPKNEARNLNHNFTQSFLSFLVLNVFNKWDVFFICYWKQKTSFIRSGNFFDDEMSIVAR